MLPLRDEDRPEGNEGGADRHGIPVESCRPAGVERIGKDQVGVVGRSGPDHQAFGEFLHDLGRAGDLGLGRE